MQRILISISQHEYTVVIQYCLEQLWPKFANGGLDLGHVSEDCSMAFSKVLAFQDLPYPVPVTPEKSQLLLLNSPTSNQKIKIWKFGTIKIN